MQTNLDDSWHRESGVAKNLILAIVLLDALLILSGAVGATSVAWAASAADIATTDPYERMLSPPATNVLPPGVAPGDEFGYAAALHGDLLVVGAHRTTVDGKEQQGVAYLFTRDPADPTRFTYLKRLVADDGQAFDLFGAAVAVHGDIVVVGATHADPGGVTNQGVAYVFERHHGGDNGWGQAAKLTGSDNRKLGNFGTTVAIHGDTIVAGAPTARGAVFVFARNQGGPGKWGEVQKLSNSAPDARDSFGSALAFDGTTLVVGVSSADLAANDNEGAVFVFEQEGGVWQEQAKLFAGDAGDHDKFGAAVALDRDRIFAGATFAEREGKYSVGKVYVFRHDGTSWEEETTLLTDEAVENGYFGRTLFATGDHVFVAASHGANGTVYLFAPQTSAVRSSPSLAGADNWQQVSAFSIEEDVNGSGFGQALAGDGHTLVAGANFYDSARGVVLAYPMADLLDTEPDEPDDPGAVEPSTLYLSVVAVQDRPRPLPPTGILGNNGIVEGVDGVLLAALEETVEAPVSVTIDATSAPATSLPSSLTQQGQYYLLAGQQDLLVPMESPFIAGLPVPAGADPEHLALAVLLSLPPHQDRDSARVWAYLDGVYDTANNQFLTTLPFLREEGVTVTLVEHAEFSSPPNGAQVGQAAVSGTRVGMFLVSCRSIYGPFPGGLPTGCTADLEKEVATFLDQVHRDMVDDFGFTNTPRLRDLIGRIAGGDSYTLSRVLGFQAEIRPTVTSDCIGNSGYYHPESALLVLCLNSTSQLTFATLSTLIHEYFHAVQYGYPRVWDDWNAKVRMSWITEGMATAAKESYTSYDTMLRQDELQLKVVDEQLDKGVVNDDNDQEYFAQDFWVYAGQRHGRNLGYLAGILENGGATTDGVAAALEQELGVPFADLYWGWVKNQIMEKRHDLGGGLGPQCALTADALATEQPTARFDVSQTSVTFPLDGSYTALDPLHATVIELNFSEDLSGAIVEVMYDGCDNNPNLGDYQDIVDCRVDKQQFLHAKIYVENEPSCIKEHVPDYVRNDLEGLRELIPLDHNKRHFAVIANGDRKKPHKYTIVVEPLGMLAADR